MVYLLRFIKYQSEGVLREAAHAGLPETRDIWCADSGAVECETVKVNFTLEEATKTQRGSIGIAPLFPWPRR
jgi:hypothetical protein